MSNPPSLHANVAQVTLILVQQTRLFSSLQNTFAFLNLDVKDDETLLCDNVDLFSLQTNNRVDILLSSNIYLQCSIYNRSC